MKQSNITYKQTEYFSSDFKKTPSDLPSVNAEPTINTKINENPYRANVEIEKDEIVLRPDLSALHKAGGKKHSQGGTSVYLKPDSFVFSDDKSLAFTKKDHELFEFKKGGKFRPHDNTPAKVLEKNVDLKHYNKLSTNLADPHKDEIAKESSALMLEKYIQTIGNIAFLQEAKKDFPQGQPEFSQGTAPVYNTQLKEEIVEQKQYAKYGGTIDNPYKMQSGGSVKIPTGTPLHGNTKGWQKIGETETHVQYMTQSGQTKVVPKAGPKMSDADWTKFINSPQGKATRHLRQQSAPVTKYGFTSKPFEPIKLQRGELPMGTMKPVSIPAFTPSTPEEEKIVPGDPTGTAQNGIPIDWEFTPWQKVSQGYNAMKWAGVKRHMPYRSHLNSTFVDPSLLNPEQAVGDIKAAGNQQIAGANTLNPILRNAQAQSIYGQGLGAAASIRSQYDNQNAQILNQTRQYNNQVKNNESLVNMQNDQNYYKESVLGRQNFDNMRTYLGDQWMNNVMRDVETNQALAYNLATLNNPAYGYDWKSGNFYRNEKNILDAQSNGVDTRYQELLKMANEIGDPVQKMKFLIDLEKVSAFKGANRGMKKGGRINPYK